MKLVNLKPTVYTTLDQSEINKALTFIPEGFEVIQVSSDIDTDTKISFKFIPKKKEFKLTDKSVLKFNTDKDGYSIGWINLSKETEGYLEDYSDSNELIQNPWNGVQYNRSIHFDAKIREPRCKTWTRSYIGQILDYSYKTYEYDTELSDIQISETLTTFAKKFVF